MPLPRTALPGGGFRARFLSGEFATFLRPLQQPTVGCPPDAGHIVQHGQLAQGAEPQDPDNGLHAGSCATIWLDYRQGFRAGSRRKISFFQGIRAVGYVPECAWGTAALQCLLPLVAMGATPIQQNNRYIGRMFALRFHEGKS